MIINLSRTYILVCDKHMSAAIGVRAALKLGSLESVPGVENFLFIPQLPDSVVIVSTVGTAALAEGLRSMFPGQLFMLSSIAEMDGFLPKAAWDFIQASGVG
jgi:hypothetical protein